jgi:hypothetical protein
MEEELSRRLQGYDSTAASVSVTATERGVIKHVFSHRVHHMTIGWQYVSPASSEQPLVCPENTRCWMTEQELKDVGLTTGQKKILRLYIKAQQTSKPAKKKRKVKKKSKKQQQLPAPAAASTTAVKTEHTLLGMFAQQRNKNNNKKHTTKAPEDVPALE